jgi:peptidoglycan/LPS O-acetylase OafA/YrhL
MYYVSLLLTFIVGGLILKEFPIKWQWIYSVFFLNMFIPTKEFMWWNSVNYFWTMPSFVAWYIVLYPLFRKINNSKNMVMITLVMSVLSPFLKKIMINFASIQFVNWYFFCLVYCFCLGALAYFIINEGKHKLGLIYGIFIGFAGVIAVVLTRYKSGSGFFIFGVIFYFMIVLADWLPIRWNNNKVNVIIQKLSIITYSIYLTHWFILKLIGDYLEQLPWMIGYLMYIVIVFIIGYLSYRFIEKPLTNMGVN